VVRREIHPARHEEYREDLHHVLQELFSAVDHSKNLVILDKSPFNY
jgi:hypothetical protein